MSGPIVRSGSSEQYSTNWSRAFSTESKKRSAAKPAKKKTTKKKKKKSG